MNTEKNFFKRALDAIVEGRSRQAKRYLAQYERNNPSSDNKFTGW